MFCCQNKIHLRYSKMAFLKKIQDLPEKQRMVILWIALAAIIVLVIIFWLWQTGQTIESFKATGLESSKILKEIGADELQGANNQLEEAKNNLSDTKELEEAIKAIEKQGSESSSSTSSIPPDEIK